ncbi:hypothetical protein HME9304_01226 [Flagellimonas maritima]|uniref:WD40 repeat protein n=2 Tax=Flagellimonas maritima TaxID=1383885 RepID=A0A2Z4LQY2_9FLAO|nr:hypothetical protein HME9304_01226 [Allomuricauda aurantiaca]
MLSVLVTNAQEKFADGIICTVDYNEYGLTFITENWICFTKSEDRNTLMFSRYENNSWTKPIIAPFSGVYPDEYPRFDRTTSRLFFASKRPSENDKIKASNDIWYVELKNDMWSKPIHLEGNFSTNGIESGAESSNGIIYFHSDRKGKGLNDVDIYSLPLGATEDSAKYISVSSEKVDGEPYIFNNGNAMLFMSAGHNTVGNGDIFLTLFENDEWTTPTPVDTTGKVNTIDWEYSPVLSPDLKTLYFTRYVNGQADIFQIDVKLLSNKELQNIANLN